MLILLILSSWILLIYIIYSRISIRTIATIFILYYINRSSGIIQPHSFIYLQRQIDTKFIWELLLSIIHQYLYKLIWPRHCSHLKIWERHHGITSKRKRSTFCRIRRSLAPSLAKTSSPLVTSPSSTP
jgi:hypothetical protein